MISKKTFRIAISAIFVAIILVQTFVPYIGYIRILPGLPSITTIPLTVALAGCLMGPGFGASIGLFWGLLSMFVAYTQPGDIVSMLLFRNILIALVPRTAAGFIAGMIGQAAKDDSKFQKTVVYTITGLCTSLTNTLLVVGITSLWYMKDPSVLLHSLGQTQNSAPLWYCRSNLYCCSYAGNCDAFEASDEKEDELKCRVDAVKKIFSI